MKWYKAGGFYVYSILMTTVMCGTLIGCVYQGSPLMTIIVENQTTQNLKLAVDDFPVGEVQPGAQISRNDVDMDMGEYLIEAKNSQGEVIFSETYNFNPDEKYHLQKVDSRTYKAVIPPLGK